jgi:hypothetical protein
LVNDPGVAFYNSFAGTPVEEFDQLFNVNVKSLFFSHAEPSAEHRGFS